MYETIPEKLLSDTLIFHYTKKRTALEDIINLGKLKYNKKNSTNDPKEYRDIGIYVHNANSNESNYELAVHYADQIKDALNKKLRICCFCQNSPEPRNKLDRLGFLKPRMWSQYGENHSGVCLAFEKDTLIWEISRQLKDEDYFYYQEIKYVFFEGLKDPIYSIDIKDACQYSYKEYMNILVNRYKENLFYQKHKDYKDENEFRIALIDFNEEYEYMKYGRSMRSIIIGDRYPEDELSKIMKIAFDLGIDIYKIKWIKGLPTIRKL